MSLIDDMKPKTLADIVGHETQLATVRKLAERPGWTGDSFAFLGPTGTGKTSIANALCLQFCDPFMVHELDGDACTLEAVRSVLDHWSEYPLYGDWKAVIVNEAHAMTEKAVQAWLTGLERRPAKRIVCFTTTEANPWGRYTDPMLGRCKVIRLMPSPQTRTSFADKLVALAASSGKTLDRFMADAWLTKHTGSFRAALQELDVWL